MTPMSRAHGNKTRYGALVAVLLAFLIAVSGHGTAWAEETDSSTENSVTTTTENSGAAAKDDKPAKPETSVGATDPSAKNDTDDSDESDESDENDSLTDDSDIGAEPSLETEAPEPELEVAKGSDTSSAVGASNVKPVDTSNKLDVDDRPQSEAAEVSRLSKSPVVEKNLTAAPLSTVDSSAKTAAATTTAAVTTAAVTLTQPTPGPVSPIAEIVALPGRIVNAVLQLVGITTAANVGPAPISPAPLADLFFAVFRRLEEAFGLTAPVSVPTPPTMTYDGPLDVKTPTVAQFLNAATTEYVLGGTPGGMVPFTVDGWPMTSLHLGTGSDASVWVTPENQIIIAYSGTTGGTNLLFNPLIAITQILTDIQGGFTNQTPRAFLQAVDFAKKVREEAVKQGYDEADVFVTGHSLGAWQAQYVAQQLNMRGIGFEGPGLSTTVPGNGADSLFVNTATYGDMAAYLSSDLPGLYPFVPYPYEPAGGLHPHYGPIVMLGDPAANNPMINSARLFGKGIIGTLIAAIDLFGNFFASHLPGVQAYNLDVQSDPGVVPWLGINRGPVLTDFGDLTIPELLKAASDKGILVRP